MPLAPPALSPAAALLGLLAVTGCVREQVSAYGERLDADGDGAIYTIDCEPQNEEAYYHLWYLDLDGDGHGDPATQIDQCAPPEDGRAWVDLGDDCNDADAAVYAPVEGYADADADGFGAGERVTLCDAGDALAQVDGDCADGDATVYPGADPVCGNGKDDDCDGAFECEPPTGTTQADQADRIWTGGDSEALGASISALGDVDGDGSQDLSIGAPDELGAVYVLYGPLDQEGDLRVTAAAHLFGAGGAAAGSAVAGLGDVDGDGLDDFLIGAPDAADGGVGYLVYGPIPASTDGEVDLTNDRDILRLSADSSGDNRLGAVVVGLGDVRANDGLSDLTLAAPGDNAVYIAAGPVDGHLDLEDAALAVAGGRDLALGEAAARVGDLDGDGRAELAIGAPGYGADTVFGVGHGLERAATGAVYVLWEALGGDVEDVSDAVILGDRDTPGLGGRLGDPGDVDGDGRGDLLVGAPTAGDSAGVVWLVSGSALAVGGELDADDVQARFVGSDVGEEAGSALAGAGDRDQDGWGDVVVGSPSARRGGWYAVGAVGLWLGPFAGTYATENADAVWRGLEDEGGFGAAMAVTPSGDLVVGAPGIGQVTTSDTDHGFHGDGSAYLFYLGW